MQRRRCRTEERIKEGEKKPKLEMIFLHDLSFHHQISALPPSPLLKGSTLAQDVLLFGSFFPFLHNTERLNERTLNGAPSQGRLCGFRLLCCSLWKIKAMLAVADKTGSHFDFQTHGGWLDFTGKKEKKKNNHCCIPWLYTNTLSHPEGDL